MHNYLIPYLPTHMLDKPCGSYSISLVDSYPDAPPTWKRGIWELLTQTWPYRRHIHSIPTARLASDSYKAPPTKVRTTDAHDDDWLLCNLIGGIIFEI